MIQLISKIKALIIILDGCNEEYINDLPFLRYLKNVGVYTKIGLSPTFANRVEIMSGNPSSITDTFVDLCYDPRNSPFKFLRFFKAPIDLKKRSFISRNILIKLSYLISGYSTDPINIPSPFLPFFSLNTSLVKFQKEEKKKSTNHLFGILEKNGFKVKFIYGDEKNIEERLKRYSPNKNEVLILHYGNIDKVGHEYGPKSIKIKETLKLTSASIQKIYNLLGPIDFTIIFSDHNMVEVENCIDLWGELKKIDVKPIKDYLFFLNSPMARFWFKNNHVRRKVEDFLSFLKCGRIITNEELSQKMIPIGKKYGELIFWLKKGWHISPDFYHLSKIKGIHGYFDDSKKIPLIVFHNNKKIKLKKEGKLKDIAPTILELLNIENKEKMEGESFLVKQ